MTGQGNRGESPSGLPPAASRFVDAAEVRRQDAQALAGTGTATVKIGDAICPQVRSVMRAFVQAQIEVAVMILSSGLRGNANAFFSWQIIFQNASSKTSNRKNA